MSVYFRFLVDDYLVNERTQNFGREFFKISVPNDKRIIIEDNGDGMSYEEVKDNFLV